MKLYELVLLQKLESQIKNKHLIHPNQRGFVAGKSTIHNLHDVNRVMKFYHKEIQEDIDKKLETKKRPKHFLLFVDLKKAFDTINRAKLIESLYEK